MPRITVDPAPTFSISPRLYMQFMEPLGTTDASVEAAWDYNSDEWRKDFVATVRDMAPGAIRWGGILTSYWKWQEGVGPRERRKPMFNYLWGGVQTNQVGVHELLDLCEEVGAEPIIAVNFASDGRPEYVNTIRGERRTGTAQDAADLVRYCNNLGHSERRTNGRAEPWRVKFWQIGNETSYPKAGHRFSSADNVREYRTFAEAMRSADRSIQLIGWGDQERDTDKWWAEDLLREAGDLVDLVALHMMHQKPDNPHTVLRGREYRNDYQASWTELCSIYDKVDRKLTEARDVIQSVDASKRVAITEGHLSLQPYNKCEILREWISALYHARVLNLYERNADFVDIATLADFVGASWLVNAVMLGSPRESPYLLPVGHVMRLFRKYGGDTALNVTSERSTLDVTASRRGRNLYLHVANTDLQSATNAEITVTGIQPSSAAAHQIAPDDLSTAIDTTAPNVFDVETCSVPVENGTIVWRFPKASVTSLEVQV